MKQLILTAKIIAGLSFIIGTILCAIYLYFDHPSPLEHIGLFFIIGAFWINIIVLLVLVICLVVQNQLRFELLKTCGLMLLNIPIAFGYFLLVIHSLELSNKF